MKKCNLVVFLISTFLLFSCSNREEEYDVSMEEDTGFELTEAEKGLLARASRTNNSISIENAMQEAEQLANLLDLSGKGLKSGQKREIADIKVVSGITLKTKSNADDSDLLPDTLAYIFNYADDGGFALISADQRISESVLAYSLSGNLGDSTDNPGLAIFLDNAADRIIYDIKQAEYAKDSLLQVLAEKYGREDLPSTKSTDPGLERVDMVEVPDGPWETSAIVEPLLPVEWGQREPYNDLVKNKKSCGTIPTGCVAVAAAQIMAYWKHPKKLDNVELDWTSMRVYITDPDRDGAYLPGVAPIDVSAPAETKYQIAYVMERIGAHTDMEYDCDLSGTNTEDARDYMNRIGLMGGNEQKWDFNEIIGSLKAGCPVLADGFRTLKYINLFGQIIGVTKDGHTWVIDGYLVRKQRMKVIITYYPRPLPPRPGELPKKELPVRSTTYTYRYSRMTHINWGWNGRDNGFFMEGCFDASKMEFHSNTKSVETSEKNYKFNNKIYPYIKKR
ncbi:MAG: C10 family peptidase [Prevotella sp.]|jgi:hypothetical protein|nr:C10 family peptidase [Prevotella sp.]